MSTLRTLAAAVFRAVADALDPSAQKPAPIVHHYYAPVVGGRPAGSRAD